MNPKLLESFKKEERLHMLRRGLIGVRWIHFMSHEDDKPKYAGRNYKAYIGTQYAKHAAWIMWGNLIVVIRLAPTDLIRWSSCSRIPLGYEIQWFGGKKHFTIFTGFNADDYVLGEDNEH